MFGCISLCIGDKCIVVNGKKLFLGELSFDSYTVCKEEK